MENINYGKRNEYCPDDVIILSSDDEVTFSPQPHQNQEHLISRNQSQIAKSPFVNEHVSASVLSSTSQLPTPNGHLGAFPQRKFFKTIRCRTSQDLCVSCFRINLKKKPTKKNPFVPFKASCKKCKPRVAWKGGNKNNGSCGTRKYKARSRDEAEPPGRNKKLITLPLKKSVFPEASRNHQIYDQQQFVTSTFVDEKSQEHHRFQNFVKDWLAQCPSDVEDFSDGYVASDYEFSKSTFDVEINLKCKEPQSEPRTRFGNGLDPERKTENSPENSTDDLEVLKADFGKRNNFSFDDGVSILSSENDEPFLAGETALTRKHLEDVIRNSEPVTVSSTPSFPYFVTEEPKIREARRADVTQDVVNISRDVEKVSIVEDQNEIEPSHRPLRNNIPIHPVDSHTLTNDILFRICNWSYDWIEKQKKYINIGPPPLLQMIKRKYGRDLPELSLLPIIKTYHSLGTYCDTYSPLMLHEIWANLCKKMETQLESFSAWIYSNRKFCHGFAVLQCKILSSTRLSDMDLVSLSVHFSSQEPKKCFGVVRKNRQRDGFDQCFDLWIKMSNVPTDLDKFFVVTIIAPLHTDVKQFILNAELARSPLCDVILCPRDNVDAFKLDAVDVEENHAFLNPFQYKAVESISRTIVCASNREPKVALLQGPPGTGKSYIIVELISRIMCLHYEKTNEFPRILVCASSNDAIDEIANCLVISDEAKQSQYNIVRIGITAHPNVVRISLGELISKFVATRDSSESGKLRTLTNEQNHLQEIKKYLISLVDAANKKGQLDEARMHGRKLGQLLKQIELVNRSYQECLKTHTKYFNSEKELTAIKKHLISRAQIICTALNSCRSREMEKLFIDEKATSKPFLCCILDDASQCTEPESLTPLAFGISKIVLIGDPDQLSATLNSEFAAKHRFDQSLFNRLITNMEKDEGVVMLNTQYRMAPSICEWPSKYFYGGKLPTGESVVRNGPFYHYRVLNLIDGLEQKENNSVKNEKEAALVAKIVMLAVSSPLTRGKSVGVITFFRSQQQCISKQISTEDNGMNTPSVAVNTVDSSQLETDIVIVSCVRAREEINLNREIDFVSSVQTLQRIKVAMTRAKESLIVCGHFHTLQLNETMKDLINNAKNRGVDHIVTSDYTCDDLRPLIMRP